MRPWLKVLKVLSLVVCYTSSPILGETKGFLFENGEYSYKIVLSSEDERSWFEAEQICQQNEGGHLASILSKEENRFLNEKIQLLSYSKIEPEQLWIGAIDELIPGAFHWANGEKFEYKSAFWATGEPNLQFNEDFEVCIALRSSEDLADWVDADCYETRGYICKIEGVPKRLTEHKRFGYEFDHGNAIYKFIFIQRDMLTWPEAEVYCRDVEEGHLTSVRDLQENNRIEKILRRLRYYFGFSKVWIGASDLYHEGRFIWTDESPFRFERWIKGEPSGQRRGKKEDCAVMTADPHWGHWKDEHCLHHLPFMCRKDVCLERADIAFAVDASRSVRINGFRRSKEFIENVLKGLSISQDGVHIGLIRFGTRSDVIFGLEDHFTYSSIAAAIKTMKYTRGGTRTYLALSQARTSLFAGSSRQNIAKFLIVLTDGMSRNVELTAQEARALKNEDVHVVVVAVGRTVHRKELVSMASRQQDIIRVRSYASLGNIVKNIQDRVCNGIED